jgi:hypothetical protein
MANPADRTIDLEPAVLAAVEQLSDDVVLVFPSQPSYNAQQTAVPYFTCKMRISKGVIERNDAVLPLETDEWRVEYLGGSRQCFLPIGFEAAGPVRVTFLQRDVPKLIVAGDRFEFIVGAQVASHAIEGRKRPR